VSERAAIGPWATVLMYHRVVPDRPARDPWRNCVTVRSFESHLRWLRLRGFETPSLDLLETVIDGGGRVDRRARMVFLTFDDGYADNYTWAWPLLRRYGFTATIFLVSDAIGGMNDFDSPAAMDRVPMLTVPQIREMHKHGITFGSHSRTHPASLDHIGPHELERELIESRIAIESIVDAPVREFAYPHARLGVNAVAAVRRAGYRLAFAGRGTRFERHAISRVPANSRSGVALEGYVAWRRSKWRVRRGVELLATHGALAPRWGP